MDGELLRFGLAGVAVELRAAPGGLTGLAAGYSSFPLAPGRSADVVIEIERVPGFGAGRPQGPDYPAFAQRVAVDGGVIVERYDAVGHLRFAAGGELPLHARFRVDHWANSLEACIRIALSMALPRRGGLILHGSAVEQEAGALAFTGVSGAGKSTISALLDGQPDGAGAFAKIVDELCVLALGDGDEVLIHTAPFLGMPGLPLGRQVPLRALHFLEQAPHHVRTLVPARQALGRLLGNVLVYAAEPGTAQRVLDVAAEIVARVPCFHLAFAKSPAVARVFSLPPGTVAPSMGASS